MNLIRKISILAISMILCSSPVAAFAYHDVSPDGTHSLAEIFSGENDNALAKDIASAINGNDDVRYKPASASEFNSVNIVSLASTNTRSFYGLQYCKNLKTLSVPRNNIADENMDIFPDLRTLTHVNIGHNNITSASLTYFSSLSLKILTMDNNPVTSENLEVLPTSIVDLDFTNCRVGDVGARKIANRLPSLTFLALSGSNISDTGILHIGKLSKLEELRVSNNKIGDVGAKAIAKAGLSKLEILDLSNNNITDIGALELTKISNPSDISLNLKENSISPIGISALKSAGFKNLALDGQVIYESPIKSARAPIIHKINFDTSYIVNGSISNAGALNISEKTITWSPRKSNKTLTYKFACEGYSGTVNVPFIYEPYVFTVTFDDCLGNKTKVETLDDEVVKLPKDPKRKGYTFLGWYYNADATSSFDHGSTITKDVYVYAGWAKNTADVKDEEDNGSLLPKTGDASIELLYMLCAFSISLFIVGLRCLKIALFYDNRHSQS